MRYDDIQRPGSTKHCTGKKKKNIQKEKLFSNSKLYLILHFVRQWFGSFLSLIILQGLFQELRGTLLTLIISQKNASLLKRVFPFQSFGVRN